MNWIKPYIAFGDVKTFSYDYEYYRRRYDYFKAQGIVPSLSRFLELKNPGKYFTDGSE